MESLTFHQVTIMREQANLPSHEQRKILTSSYSPLAITNRILKLLHPVHKTHDV